MLAGPMRASGAGRLQRWVSPKDDASLWKDQSKRQITNELAECIHARIPENAQIRRRNRTRPGANCRNTAGPSLRRAGVHLPICGAPDTRDKMPISRFAPILVVCTKRRRIPSRWPIPARFFNWPVRRPRTASGRRRINR